MRRLLTLPLFGSSQYLIEVIIDRLWYRIVNTEQEVDRILVSLKYCSLQRGLLNNIFSALLDHSEKQDSSKLKEDDKYFFAFRETRYVTVAHRRDA